MREKLALALLLSGCAIGPDTPESSLILPDSYTQAFDLPTDEEELWWNGFGDEILDGLITTSLDSNFDIAAADARLRRAEALARTEFSDLLPFTDGQLSVQFPEGSSPQSASSLVAGWTPDLFGDRRRELYAARADVLGAEALSQNARRVTASAVAATYVELRRTDAQAALLAQSLDLQQQTLRIVTLRADAGLAADLDVQRAAGDLARTRAQSGPLTEARARAANALSVLAGTPPSKRVLVPTTERRIPTYSSGPSAGVPANLLRQRPDVRSAEASLIAAGHRIGAEMADLLPSLSLSGFITSPLGTDDLAFGAFSRATAALDVPLLDAGRRLAEVRAARATADEALAVYEQSILQALADVENSLATISAAESRREDLRAAVTASEIAFEQLQALYTEGLATLIDVLDAQRQLISSREQFTNSEAAVAQAYIDLYTATGAPVTVSAGDPA
ncbi:MAG: efflux transporter outer membrane subunit [Pseudomonadota bacterium]